jgi:hypothetical protein
MLELDVEQSSSSDKTFSVPPKLNTTIWETGQSSFLRLVDFASSF